MGKVWSAMSATCPTISNSLFSSFVPFGYKVPMPSVMEALPSKLPALTATELRSQLEDGSLTSRQLVSACLDQIRAHNQGGMHLRAMISVMEEEKALAEADRLDDERKDGKLRGYFHGVPIVVKDTINTGRELGMPTTQGAPALRTAMAGKNAKLVDELISQGIIVLGKANLSELGATKSNKARAGYSPVGGQTQSAYIEGGVDPNDDIMGNTNPGGSSSGSAVAVAAGFTPLSIGCETDGSLVTPASRSSLFALKPSQGAVSDDGIFMLTKSLDSMGGMAKCTSDLSFLTEILLSTTGRALHQPTNSILETQWKDLKVGFVDPELWRLPVGLLRPTESYTRQTLQAFHDAISHVKEQGAKVVYPVDLQPASSIKFEGQSGYSIIRNAEFKPQLDSYLKTLESSPVRSLAELIEYNKEHPEIAFSPESPDQSKLINMEGVETQPGLLERAVPAIREAAGRDNIDQILSHHDLDVLLVPSDSPVSSVASLAGYPLGTMPLGYLEESGRPFGLGILATMHAEDRILSVMSAWERSKPGLRQTPAPLAKYECKM